MTKEEYRDKLYDMLDVSPTNEGVYVLKKEYRYKNIIVPTGFKTNGVSIPRLFWMILPPFKPLTLPAVVVHDYLTDLEEYELGDDMFEDLLTDLMVPDLLKNTMVKSVRTYHKIRYDVLHIA